MQNTRFSESSLLKDDLYIADHIHKSLIKIENEHPNEEEINQLITEAMTYLDKDISINTANELFSLILSCFSHYPSQLVPLYNKLLDTSTKNIYHIIMTASILSYLSRIQPQLSSTEHNSFVEDSLNQLLLQIQKNDENGLKILDHKNFHLSTKLSKNQVSNFNTSLSLHDMTNTLKLNQIYDDISDDQYLSDIDENFVTNNDFSSDSITNYSTHIPDPLFKSFFLHRDHKTLNSKRSDATFSKQIHTERSEVNDLQLYLNVFSSIKMRYPFLSTPTFWVHICSIASHSKVSISRKMANQFHFYFEMFVDEVKFDEVLNAILYSPETQTSIGMEFITQMIFNPKPFIKQNYLYNVELTELLFKILQTKITLKSCFWRLFSKSLIFREFKKTRNPLLLYGYEFAIGKFEHEFDSIEIQPLNERSNIDLYDYIQKQDFECNEKMNQEAVSLIASAFVFARKEGKVDVNGLTKENILPFLTVAFDHVNRFCQKESRAEFLINFLNYFKLNQNFTLIKQACKLLENNDSDLLKISIDRILPHLHSLLDPNFFSFRFCFSIVKILMPLLLNGRYLADEMSLLSTIFQFSNRIENDQLDSELLLLFKNNEIQLFEYIFKNLSKIIKFEELKEKPLNLAVFDNSISSFVVDAIQNSSSVNDSILFIQFIESFCINEPVFKFESSEIFERILNETIQNEMKIESSLVYQFMIKNGLICDFHHLIDRPFLLSNVQQETVTIINEGLFNQMMKNKAISMNYISLILHEAVRSGCTNNLSSEQMVKLWSNEFSDTFIETVNSLFVLDQRTKKFVLKTEIESSFSSLNFEQEFSFVSNLLSLTIQKVDHDCYNVFVILKSLAESFPFIFSSLSQLVFDSVLPSLDNSLFDVNMQNEMKSKTAISALSFLLSTLKQPEILDDFVDWLFCNIKTFNEPQILSFVILLNTLIQNGSVKNVLLSKMVKNDFLETLLFIIKRNLNELSFVNFFIEKVCCLTMTFLNSLRSMTQNDAVLVDEMMKMEKPFQTVLGHSFLKLEKILPQFSESVKSEKMVNFFGEIESVRPFWILNKEIKKNEESKDDRVDEFLSKFSSQNINKKRNKILTQIQKPLKKSMIRYLSKKPSWISMWIESPENFVLTSEHIEILNETVSELNSLKNENEIECNFGHVKHNIEKLFIEFLLRTTTNQKIDDKTFSSFCDLLKEISENEDDFQSLLKSFTFCLKKLSTSDSMVKTIEILSFLSNNNRNLFCEKFALTCGNDLIETVMTPKFKTEGEIFLKISQLLSSLEINHIPSKTVDFIGFVISNFCDPTLISMTLFLCQKVDDLKKKNLNTFVYNLFDKSVEIESETIACIPAIIDQFPSICRSRTDKLLLLLDQLLIKYRKVGDHFATEIKEDEKKQTNVVHEEKKKQNKKGNNEENEASACNVNYEEDDKKLLKKCKDEIQKKNILKNKIIHLNNNLLDELIEAILKFVAPKRIQPRNVDLKPSSEGEIPESIFNLSPDFWKLFAKHRSFITEAIVKRPILLGSTFSFLLSFPELLDYDVRYSYFVESRRKIARGSVLELTVRPTSILTDSFNLLNPLSTSDLTRNLRVKLHGEKERVQNDIYYNLLAKEIFDPRNYFFVYTENRRSFQINPRSDVIRKHIDYFRFTGKILARAMLEDHKFDIRLTSSIYKMLLKRPLDITDLKDIDNNLYTQLKAKLEEDTVDDKKDNKKNDDGVFFTLGFDDEEEEEEEFESEDDQISSENQKENRNQKYVDSMIEHRLHDPIIEQVNAFCDGFYQIIPYDQICSLLPTEFHRLFRGLPDSFTSTAEELLSSIELVPPLTPESPTVRAFFGVVRSWSDDHFSQFIFFITRSIRFGFRKLKEMGNPIKLAIGENIDLPQAHPFVHLLKIPECDDQNLLNWKFFIAFNEIESKSDSPVRKVRGKKKNSSNGND